jgi:hypothetical protein
MLQMLLSEWIVRFFLLYLFVVGGVVLIRHQQQAVARRFVFSPVSDIRQRWALRATWSALPRTMWFDKYPARDKSGIRIGYKERNNGEFWRDRDGLKYA